MSGELTMPDSSTRIARINWVTQVRQSEIELLQRSGDLSVFVVPGREIKSRSDFFTATGAVFPLDPPLVSARSWDALMDSLGNGLIDIDASLIAIIWTDSDVFAQSDSAEFSIAVSIMLELVCGLSQECFTCDQPKHIAIFLEDNSSFARKCLDSQSS